MALESIMLSPTNKQHAAQTNVVSNVDNDGYLCEPIRKQGVITSPIKNIRPSPTVCLQYLIHLYLYCISIRISYYLPFISK